MSTPADAWAAARSGSYVNFPVPLPQDHQCVALFYDYNRTVNQGETYSAAGATDLFDLVWDTYDTHDGLAGVQPGDWLIWSGTDGAYVNGGAGHVAMFTAPGTPGTVSCFSQNPDVAQEIPLSASGIRGYLRKNTMSYTLDEQYSSPNFTTPANVPVVWPGETRDVVLSITVHHWNQPGLGDTYMSTINTLCDPNNGGKSAHYVATDNRVACLISPDNAAWSTGSAHGNATTIAIECDPSESDATYQTVGELIRFIRGIFGDLPLKPHGLPLGWVATSCPGTYDLARLDSIARSQPLAPDDQFLVDLFGAL